MALLLTGVLIWPVWLGGAVFIFADTASYLRGGQAIWSTVGDLLGSLMPAASDGGGGNGGASGAGRLEVNQSGQSTTGRSFTYSAAAYAAFQAGGAAAVVFAQTWITVFLALGLITPAALTRPWVLLAGVAALAVATTLPWHASYLMPDLLAAAVILFAVILATTFRDMGPWQKLIVTALGAFAVTSHYGNLPLAAALVAVALLVAALRRRLGLATLVAGAIAVAGPPLLNLGASSAVLDTASVAPKRLPILLARSLEDGPARWYLEDACPEAPLAFCDIFGDEVPENVGAFLWSGDGLKNVTPEQMGRIRAEEFDLLWSAFQAYPVEQTTSLLGNAAYQTVLIGTGDMVPATGIDAQFRPARTGPGSEARRLQRRFDSIVPWGTWIGAAIVAALAVTGRLTGGQWAALVVVAAGLLLNAAIFGGLSAPVERYQSRVAWLLPFLAVLFLAEVTRQPAREGPA